MNPWVYIIVLFLGLTIVLLKSKHERHFLFFMIRTQYGIGLIDRLAGLSHEFWKILGDLGILASLSGTGAYYISKRGDLRNLSNIMAFLGVFGVFALNVSIPVKVVGLVLVFLVLEAARRIGNSVVNFFVASLIISMIASGFMSEWYYAVIFGFFGFPALIITALLMQAYNIIQGSMLPGVSPMLPSTKDGQIGVGFPGYDLFIPWTYALIAVIATLVPHELAHGILSRVHHVRLKSTGLLTFGGLPLGAFVEPNERSLKSKSSLSRTRIYAIGSLANFFTAILAVLVLITMNLGLAQFVLSDGVLVVGLDKGYPAEKVLEQGVVIYALNNYPLSGTASFEEAARPLKPKDNVVLNTSKGLLSFKAGESPVDKEKGYMGVLVMDNVKVKYNIPEWLINFSIINFVIISLWWIIFFNASIGMVNLLPIPPFDGYHIMGEVVHSTDMKKEDVKWAIYGIILITALIFFLNMLPLIRMAFKPVLSYFGF
jgi:membrane-associated protease RseP (regulator of RpoE activity)